MVTLILGLIGARIFNFRVGIPMLIDRLPEDPELSRNGIENCLLRMTGRHGAESMETVGERMPRAGLPLVERGLDRLGNIPAKEADFLAPQRAGPGLSPRRPGKLFELFCS